ncbi:hypothetical protein [uncultured Sulfitobacter sp.]|uniref:hypothetical protein n=1 Tax=uncultured Sulfitobacter sp. TaxID=191468 RepID=UPI0030DC3EE9|tara:strand:+ start:6441 stop:6818 length:378 start_codon:yes stop_codon:yes gene_type:complete
MTPDEQTVERDELLADLDAQSAEDGNIAARAAAALIRAQAERIKELEATLVRHRADRPFVIGWNDGFEHGVKEAANLMRSAGAKARAAQETCSKIQRRDYETSAIVHSYAADAIAALLIEGATND